MSRIVVGMSFSKSVFKLIASKVCLRSWSITTHKQPHPFHFKLFKACRQSSHEANKESVSSVAGIRKDPRHLQVSPSSASASQE